MTSPPRDIDGARVLKVASLVGVAPTGRTRHVVRGEVTEGFAALAIAHYEGRQGYYLFYCDESWNAVTDTYHDTIRDAIAQAIFEFGIIEFVEPGLVDA